ncbi:polymeric immunoglobulin receptor-like isoform X1 [Cyprinodon tularosa]|uniref:polymeric immunoglobulin receptor-like isoform X1 n=1 Tax=Cyprinodon tularosa TaxID=77115 RepID=UPI0018E24FBF|nr:polymeric immunoglobulin receptor-like isoform X1 [Cyprinodon tularosa]
MMSWSFGNVCICLCFASCCVVSAAAVIHESGYEGKGVNITCHYNSQYESHEKYLCRGDCNYDADILVKSTEPRRGRYSISDNKQKHVFVATISYLSAKDAGKYLCGVTKVGYDHFPSEVSLKVKQEWCCVKTNNMSGIIGSPITFSCPYPTQHKNNRKFICKGDHRDSCADVMIIGNRFTLQDNVSSSSFTVMVTRLEEGDGGMYWCGSDAKWTAGNYTNIQLTVEWCCGKTINIKGNLGYPLSFSCPHSLGHQENLKLFCKGDQRSNCTEMLRSQSRFVLQEETSSSSFLVMVTKLEDSDAGTYWCGSQSKWSFGNYTKIVLSVEWCCVETKKMGGIVGYAFDMSCPYPPQHWNDEKFLCKGEHRNSCTDVLLNQSRFTLQANESASSLFVKITKLEESDAGTYWCGSDPNWRAGNYTKIELSVGPSTLKIVVYIIPALLLVLLFIAVIAVYKCTQKGATKDKKRRKLEALQTISERPEDYVYKSSSHNYKAVDFQEQVYENLKTENDISSVYM